MKTGAPATAVIFSTALFVSGCENPFQTRTPEPPTRSRGTFAPPLSPGAVLRNLRNAVIEQSLVNYSRSLADPARGGNFRFDADPVVENSQPDLFANWGLEEEKQYFSQLNANHVLPPDSLRSLSFIAKDTTTFGDSAIFVEDYQLEIHHTQQAGGIARRYAGQARFTLRRDSFGEWAIHRWADFSTSATPTWSALKGSFGQ
jgi:hypothetical protein